MRRQLEGSYNIEKIIELENELRDKKRVRDEQEQEYQALYTVYK